MTRPTLDATFMDVARTFAKRATCPRASVGAVLVRDGIVLAQGWNGAVRGAPHCTEAGCDLQELHGRQSCFRAIHAEMNALLNAARTGASTLGATLYCTHAPCTRCAGYLVQAGIKRVVYAEEYGVTGVTPLRNAGVEVSAWQP
jgi:dCMP deaminase